MNNFAFAKVLGVSPYKYYVVSARRNSGLGHAMNAQVANWILYHE